MSPGTCSYISMYITAVSNSVMLQLHLWYDFNNTIFNLLLLTPQSFDWLAALHLELLQAILIIPV